MGGAQWGPAAALGLVRRRLNAKIAKGTKVAESAEIAEGAEIGKVAMGLDAVR